MNWEDRSAIMIKRQAGGTHAKQPRTLSPAACRPQAKLCPHLLVEEGVDGRTHQHRQQHHLRFAGHSAQLCGQARHIARLKKLQLVQPHAAHRSATLLPACKLNKVWNLPTPQPPSHRPTCSVDTSSALASTGTSVPSSSCVSMGVATTAPSCAQGRGRSNILDRKSLEVSSGPFMLAGAKSPSSVALFAAALLECPSRLVCIPHIHPHRAGGGHGHTERHIGTGQVSHHVAGGAAGAAAHDAQPAATRR